MNNLILKLKKYGCDVDKTLSRFLDDEAFYIECEKELLVDKDFEELGKALMASDVDRAFDAAHALKGVLSNTGLTPLLDEIILIVEPLRNGEIEGLMKHYKKLIKKKEELKDLLE